MPRTKIIAFGASLRSICWIDIFNQDPFCLRFVFNKVLQFIPRPSVKPRTHPFIAFNSFAYIGQIFHNNILHSRIDSFLNKSFTNHVICFFNASSFFARDSLKASFSRFRTVGLKFFSSSKKLISFVSKLTTSMESTIRCCCQIIFSNINSYDFCSGKRENVGDIQNSIKKPSVPFSDQLSFFEDSLAQVVFLKITQSKSTLNSPLNNVKGKTFAFNRISSFVIMDTGRFFKYKGRNVFIFLNFKNFISGRNFQYGIAYHLRTKIWKFFTNGRIAKVVQCKAIPTTVFDSFENDGIAPLRKSFLSFKKILRVFWSQNQFKGYSSFHAA